MNTKHFVLEVLEKNRDKSISGEYIGNCLNLSRNMIWRAIKDLRKEGYMIEAITNKGYRLAAENDIISAEGIKPFLISSDLANNIKVYNVIDSTNKEAKLQAINQAPHGTVIISNEQTHGQGRFGREFFSPSNSGLYMSVLLRPQNMNLINPTTITAYTALCVCEVLENLCNLNPSIKWVNDIFLDGKKISGILTEAMTDYESNSISIIVLGIGINICTKIEDFPKEIQSIAGSLYPDGDVAITRNSLAAEIINRILFTDTPPESFIFEQYKKRLFMLGRRITVIQGHEKYSAKALDINSHGHLIIQMPNGEIREILSGEIQIDN